MPRNLSQEILRLEVKIFLRPSLTKIADFELKNMGKAEHLLFLLLFVFDS